MHWILAIVGVLGLILVVIRFSPLREKLEKFDRERPERDAKTAEELRLRPLTFVLTVLFSCGCAFGLIYIFAFSDTPHDRWQHFYSVFPVLAFVGTCLAFAKKREDHAPLSIRNRRIIWGVILVGYAIACLVVLSLGLTPFSRFSDTLRLFCYLGTLAPLVFVTWNLFQKTKPEANQSLQPTGPSARG